mmetsp:Transcript_67260/g.161218  ORF Transcript_67260/g.161218 Transcript_67260/m.161218 type:complete len:264 (-) Transcript_67260:219-1010(-)
MSGNGWTELHRAAQKGDVVTIHTLIRNGASLNARDLFEYTPLHHAVEYGQRGSLETLLDYSANVNCLDTGGRTPLHMAAFSGKADLVECLIKSGADIHARDSFNWKTPLQLAKDSAHHGSAKILENAELGRPLNHGRSKGCLGLKLFSFHCTTQASITTTTNQHTPPAAPNYQEPVHITTTMVDNSDDLESLPESTYQGADDICSICLGRLPAAGAEVPERHQAHYTECGHAFHYGCLQSWCERSSACPLCKADLQQRFEFSL